MMLVLICWAVVAACEGLVSLLPMAKPRRWLSLIMMLPLAFLLGAFTGVGILPLAVLMTITTSYRLFNAYRAYAGKAAPDYSEHVSRRTSYSLIGLQAFIIAACLIAQRSGLLSISYLWAGSLYVLLSVLVAGASLRLSLKRMQPPEHSQNMASRDLPTLTVAIPARNETVDLEHCLQSLTASTYPKLEIIVLDDCSQNRRTPEIIRQFAHDGVTFVAGEAPPPNWLAKNYAYEQLTAASNGQYILFCGVDARFEPQTIGKLMEILLNTDKNMLSVMPINLLPVRTAPALIYQPFRYAWEVAVPRRWRKRPPLLSTCWLIKREWLLANGGLGAVRNAILPERYFARLAYAARQYRFFYAMAGLGLQSQKSVSEQQETTLRLRYPQLHRRVELICLVSVQELMLLVWPLTSCVYALLTANWFLGAVNILAYGLLCAIYQRVIQLTYRQPLRLGWWLFPYALITDVAMLNASMVHYELGEVLWKGRNICIPLLQVLPELPRLEEATANPVQK